MRQIHSLEADRGKIQDPGVWREDPGSWNLAGSSRDPCWSQRPMGLLESWGRILRSVHLLQSSVLNQGLKLSTNMKSDLQKKLT